LLQTPIAIYDKSEQRTVELAQVNLETCAIAKGAFQPTLRGFYNLSTRVGYADRIVGTELDALNQLPYLASEGTNQNVLRPFFTCFRKGSPFSINLVTMTVFWCSDINPCF
jgi:hypothetical protein